DLRQPFPTGTKLELRLAPGRLNRPGMNANTPRAPASIQMEISMNIPPFLKTAACVAGAFATMGAVAALAQDAAPTPDKGDTAWMMVSTIMVLFMALPGLALFYG